METDWDNAPSANEMPTICDLPEEILEYILMKVSPYNDLKSASLVCTHWYRIVKVVIRKLYQHYLQSVYNSSLTWSSIRPDAGSRITERYSHCCCYYDKSLYVFGGCTATNTTLNDLWRFDLATREWIRPLAMGTYPFPKACASLVVYKDSLVLFGGWSHPTPFPLHQAARFFSELHIYKPGMNRWSHVTTLSHQSPQPMAGHSASVIGDLMVVFGGSQVPGVRTNELWVYDFIEGSWRMPHINNTRPAPRYGQTQVTLDDKHILILGGCGGPNQVFNDLWLLTVGEGEWLWEELGMDNTHWSVPQLWCHSACKVSGMVVSLSKPAKPPNTPPSSPRIAKLRKSKAQPREEPTSSSAPPVQPNEACGNDMADAGEDQPEDSEDVSGRQPTPSEVAETKTVNPRPGLPCVRPNAMKNRQRQLEALLKFEKKLRQSSATAALSATPGTSRDSQPSFSSRKNSRSLASLMVVHVLDIAEVLETKRATWRELKFDNLSGAPDETIFYTLVEGRNELIMFGGIERDIQSLQRGHGITWHAVHNILYTLSPLQEPL